MIETGLIEAVKEMRKWQKLFFNTDRKSAAHSEALCESRKWERVVDKMLADLEADAQNPSLF